MISPISSNRPLFISAAAIVVTSVALGIFLSRVGWNGAITTYRVAMYSLSFTGVASFISFCILVTKKPNQLALGSFVRPDEIIEAEKFLANPSERQEDLLTPLSAETGLPKGVLDIVWEYAFFPTERCFMRLKMGVSLKVNDPNYLSIRDMFIHYKRIFGGTIDASLDPIPLKEAYDRLCIVANRWDVQLFHSEQSPCTLFGHMCVLLLHSQPHNELIQLEESERRVRIDDFPLRLLAEKNRLDAMTHVLSHVNVSFAVFAKMRFLVEVHSQTEEMGILTFDILLDAWRKLGRPRFSLFPDGIINKGHALLLEKIFKFKKFNSAFDYDTGTSLWESLFAGAVQVKRGDYLKVAILLLQNQIRFPLILPCFQDKKPKLVAEENDLGDLQRLITLLHSIRGKPFVGTLTDEELVTFNARIIQGGLVT